MAGKGYKARPSTILVRHEVRVVFNHEMAYVSIFGPFTCHIVNFSELLLSVEDSIQWYVTRGFSPVERKRKAALRPVQADEAAE